MASCNDNTYQVVYKVKGEKKTMIVNAKDPHGAGKRVKGGRVVSIRKINTDDIFGFSNEKFQSLMTPNKKMLTGEE